jgi:multiple sugar transport system substrate-binding protein
VSRSSHDVTVLRAIGWDHPRCIAPMQACSTAWRAEAGVDIEWEWRSLTAFGDQPLEELASGFDLLLIDHPFCGTAAAAGCLTPLDELLSADALGVLALDAVGQSHPSYLYAGHQWALATDGACQVTAVRDDLLDGREVGTWAAVVELARERPGAVALPLAPAHSISSLLTLLANAGELIAAGSALADRAAGIRAVGLLAELYALGPEEALDWEPPQALALLTSTDDLTCIPLTYGYVTYARAGDVERPCRFTDIPSAGLGPVGAVLGGAGLAVSSSSLQPGEAAAFAAWASGADAQCRLVAPAGGQPGSRTAWLDADVDAAAGGFYSGTLKTIESAWVRPRESWWPHFQLAAGRLLTEALATGTAPAATFDELDSCYRDSIRRQP